MILSPHLPWEIGSADGAKADFDHAHIQVNEGERGKHDRLFGHGDIVGEDHDIFQESLVQVGVVTEIDGIIGEVLPRLVQIFGLIEVQLTFENIDGGIRGVVVLCIGRPGQNQVHVDGIIDNKGSGRAGAVLVRV